MTDAEMEDIHNLYEHFMGEKQDFHINLNKILVGKVCTIDYWKNGKKQERKATILAADHADSWGITIHIGIHRHDGQPGYLDDHSASWTKLSRVRFE
jgi:hypothetical protein